MKKSGDENMVTLSVKVRKDQFDYLSDHQLLTGNKKGDVIRILIDYYMALDAKEGE